MSLTAVDGLPLTPMIRPYVNWTELPNDRIERLENILGTLDDKLFPGGIIPRFQSSVMLYYAVTPSAKEWRQLASLLRACIGSTVTNFTGPTVAFDESDPLEAVLIEHGYQRGARFTAGNDAPRGRYALSALARLRSLVDGSQITPTAQPRATGEVLREFELSLAALDRRSAENALTFLRVNLRLDAINLAFLTIRLHAKFREWQQIRELGTFASLCQTRRTPKVTTALAEAVYRTDLIQYEVDDNLGQALSVFRETILPQVGTLFDTCPIRVTPAAGKAFLLAAGAVTPPDQRAADHLRGMVTEWPEREYEVFRRIYEICFPAETTSPNNRRSSSSTLQNEIDSLRNEVDASSVERARAGLLSATQINTLEAFQVVVRYVEALPTDKHGELLDNSFHRKIYEDMAEAAGGHSTPKSWADWIDNLPKSPKAMSRDFADFAGSEWLVREQLKNDSDVHRLAHSIQTAPVAAQDRLFDTLPYLVQWLQDDASWPDSRLLPLYRAVYDHLLINLSDSWRREAVGASRELLDGMLELGPRETSYTQLLADLRDVLPPEAGRDDIDVLIDLAEVIVVHSSPNPDARQRLWARIVSALNPLRSVMNTQELVLVNDLGRVFEMDEVFPVPVESSEESANWSVLERKTVAIYTLTESVAQRARRLLTELHPGVRVETSHDHGGNSRLESLARRADIFVVCWRSATHAATELIGRLRPTNLVTLYPTGKGSASILRVIQEYLSK